MNQLQEKKCRTCNVTIDEYKTYCQGCVDSRKKQQDRLRYYDKKEKRIRNIQRECPECGILFIPVETGTYVCCSEACNKTRTKKLQQKNKRFRRLPENIMRINRQIERHYLKLQALQNKKINLCVEYESLKMELKK